MIGHAVNCYGTYGRWIVLRIEGERAVLAADSSTGVRYRYAALSDLSNVSERPALDPR